MFPVLITIDTEYSSGFYGRDGGGSWRDNFDRTIACKSACKSSNEEAGIFYQMDVFERYGLKGSFFVDPMPALIWGQEAIDAIVQPILKRGHEVQLHLHSEWLQFAQDNPSIPITGKVGQNIKDFSQAEQRALLEYGAHVLVEAGADFPIAYRAGNYGANDDTLSALADLGIRYDTSFPPGIASSLCDISLSADDHQPVAHQGVIEVPIASINAGGNAQRHGQITALSKWEMAAAIAFAQHHDWPNLVLVSHSFEMFNREKQHPNKVVMRRFESLCQWIAETDGVDTSTFNDLHAEAGLQPAMPGANVLPLLPHNPLRTAHRMAEQFASNYF